MCTETEKDVELEREMERDAGINEKGRESDEEVLSGRYKGVRFPCYVTRRKKGRQEDGGREREGGNEKESGEAAFTSICNLLLYPILKYRE